MTQAQSASEVCLYNGSRKPLANRISPVLLSDVLS